MRNEQLMNSRMDDFLEYLGCPDCWIISEPKSSKVIACLPRNQLGWFEVKEKFAPKKVIVNRPKLVSSPNGIFCSVCNREFKYTDGVLNLMPFSIPGVANNLRLFYENDYDVKHPSWHKEDAPIKANELLSLLETESKTYPVIAEIGCGAGFVLNIIQRDLRPKISFALDISRTALAKAQITCHEENTVYVLADIHFLPLCNNSIDLLINSDVIEHAQYPSRVIQEQARAGRIFVAKIPLENVIYTWVKEALGDNRRKKMREKYGHLHHFGPFDIRPLFSENGLCITKVRYIKIPNREGATRIIQNIIYKYLPIMYPVTFGGFIIVSATSETNF